MRHPLFWGIVIGAAGMWAFHAFMPGQHAAGAPGGA